MLDFSPNHLFHNKSASFVPLNTQYELKQSHRLIKLFLASNTVSAQRELRSTESSPYFITQILFQEHIPRRQLRGLRMRAEQSSASLDLGNRIAWLYRYIFLVCSPSCDVQTLVRGLYLWLSTAKAGVFESKGFPGWHNH